MAPTRLILHEEDVIRLVLEFFNNRELYISQLSLERETGKYMIIFVPIKMKIALLVKEIYTVLSSKSVHILSYIKKKNQVKSNPVLLHMQIKKMVVQFSKRNQ